MNGYEVSPEDVRADASMWQEVAGRLSGAATGTGAVHLDEDQLSFASTRGLATAYGQVVERFARLAREGDAEAQRYAETLGNIATNYEGTDADSSQRIGASGDGLGGGSAGGW